MAIIPGAEPFYLPGGKTGILLVHGFTGAPSEMRLAGEYLNHLGYTIFAPRLSGHGTTPEDMAKTIWPHWYSSVEDGYHVLRSSCSNIAAVGLSMGGLLVLKLASEYPVSKLAVLSAPIYIANKRLPLLPFYRVFTNYVAKKRKRLPNVAEQYSINYERTPLNSLNSLLKLIRHVDALLPFITVPTLVVQSKKEHTVEPVSAQYIYNKLGSTDKKLLWLQKSGHIVTLDTEREYVFQELGRFLAGDEKRGALNE
ncbi:alpha/beta hydrolase [Sporomusa acidovorans]|uniref:Carboxylesterase n=1 Tax=Sporomusa acidovorans (strain ATCC 49682 / DSM 3132 / Mol) TaxID=1123286 RepID=A0ABZ3J6H2_SPOA4|nr:alpha/beta fold hydrolase [Sporomusa acidovorans]OZC19480.1 carboxylesterase [Sporomusa acidovorans DSM 3132]SDF80775.1 carboxylesterase [Sporomusa acidovorans]